MRRGARMRPAIFLDRDGTINYDFGYIATREKFKFVPGVIEALKKFTELGYELIVITNQSGVARGYFTEKDVEKLHQYMRDELLKYGIRLKSVSFCPHHPKGIIPGYSRRCACRKPAPGLILREARRHDIWLGASFMVGDKVSDMVAGKRAGCRGIQLKRKKWCKDLLFFSKFLCKKLKGKRKGTVL